MKAKFLSLLFAVLLAVFCLTACEPEPEPESVHVHTEVIDAGTQPTCTESGLTEGKHCSVCNEVIIAQNEIKALGHTEAIDAGIQPTCTESGLTEGKHCSVCNEVIIAQNEIKALGHIEVIDAGKAATGFAEGLSEGKHCLVCKQVLVAQQTLAIVPPVDIDFASGTVTKYSTTLNTNTFKLNIPANVYVPDDLVDNINTITSVMETVSGLKFSGKSQYSSGRVNVEVVKLTDSERELGPAYASPYTGITISSGDLVDLSTLIHEGSHTLQYNQSNWHYCTWAMEGISTYTTYKTQAYIEQNYPDLVATVGSINQSFNNYHISNYNELYKHPLEYWMENTFEFSGNNNYSIGYRFMWYLDETYGNYTKWITEYEKINPYYSSNGNTNALSISEQIKAFKLAYGEDVFDGFYPWLKNNEAIFNANYTIDLSTAQKFQLYPTCAYREIYYSYHCDTKYNDLYIDIDAVRYYLNEYKNKSTNGMKLTVNVNTGSAVIELYDSEGRLLRTETSTNRYIDLDGVSFVKLVGSGSFSGIKISGFQNYSSN